MANRQNWKIIILLLSLITVSNQIKNKAIIMNAGKFFYNYRMENNIHSIRNILLKLGFDERDVKARINL